MAVMDELIQLRVIPRGEKDDALVVTATGVPRAGEEFWVGDQPTVVHFVRWLRTDAHGPYRPTVYLDRAIDLRRVLS
jgi:hypothetical protein